jgi:hypothetical protein
MTHIRNIKISFFFLSLLIFFAACKSNTNTQTRDIQLLSDSTAYHNNTFSDTSKMKEEEATREKVNVKNEPVKRNPSKASASNNSGNSAGTSHSTANTSSSGTASNSGTSTTTSTKKEGWSKAAQGAVIGGVGGAVGGAIISKKKGTGAAIGAAVGAAGGYIIGREKDKKDGRVKK